MYISQNDIESIWLYKCHISIKFATILVMFTRQAYVLY